MAPANDGRTSVTRLFERLTRPGANLPQTQPDRTPPALEVKHLSAGYGRAQVLFDISFELPQGKVLAVLGSNGAGKTTLLEALSGGVATTSGEVRLYGTEGSGARPWSVAQAGLCYIQEGGGIFAALTVRDNLVLSNVTAHCSQKDFASRLVEVYDVFPVLAQRQSQLAGSLSGGEKRMLALSRVILSAPRLLLVDEPSLGLAPIVVDQLYDFLSERRSRDGTTMVIVEQFAARVLQLADRAIVLAKGTVAFNGAATVLLGDPTLLDEAYFGAGRQSNGDEPAGAEKLPGSSAGGAGLADGGTGSGGRA